MDVIASDLDVMAVQFGHSLMESDLKQFEEPLDHSDGLSEEPIEPHMSVLETESNGAQNYNYLPPDVPETKQESNFVCTECGMTYTKQSSLSNHRLSKHAFVCENCGSRFGVRSNYESHVQFGCGRTPTTPQYECAVCHKMLQSKKTLNKHMKHHYGIGEYRCQICKRLFQQRTHLDSHMRTHDGQKPFACRLCGNTYSEKSSMTRHLRKIHNTNDTDLIENRIFEAVNASLSKETDETDSNEYLLENQEQSDCELNSNVSNLPDEEPTSQNNISVCKKSDDKIDSSSPGHAKATDLEDEKVDNEINIYCENLQDELTEILPIGEKKELEPTGNDGHEKENVSESSESYNSCDDEDDGTPGIPPPNIGEIMSARIKKAQRDLNWALITKQRENTFGNLSINNDLQNKNDLLSDQIIVNKIVQVPISRDCHICGKNLSSPSALRKHVIRHNDENAYKCVLCKKSFLTVSALQEHMRAHQFEKKIKCDFCKVMFTEKSTYRRHLRRFHDFSLDGAREYVHENCKELGPEDYLQLMNVSINSDEVKNEIETSEPGENQSENQKNLGSLQSNSSTSVNQFDDTASENSIFRRKLNFEDGEVEKDAQENNGTQQSNKDVNACAFLPQPRVHDCHMCGKLLGTSTSLRRHIRRHRGEFRCTVCKHLFSDSDTLHQHMSVHNQQYLICAVCGKTMTERSRYRSHLKTVHGFTLEGAQAYADGLLDVGKEVKKELEESENENLNGTEHTENKGDDKKLNKKTDLTLIDSSTDKSVEVNEGDSIPIDSLDTEGKSSEASKDTFNATMHYVLKSYECPICGKLLGDASSRSKHIRRHDGHVAFECKTCYEVFPQIRLIESHIKTHTSRGTKCNVCLLYFSDRSSARRHLVKIHGLSPNSNQIEQHMADCFGGDGHGGGDSASNLNYSVIDIKKNPNVKVRDCYNSVLSSAVYQKLYETGREKPSDNVVKTEDELKFDINSTPEKVHGLDTNIKTETDLKQESIKEDIDLYINQNSNAISSVKKRKAKDQLFNKEKINKTEMEESHMPLKLVFKRKQMETADDSVDSPKFSIKGSGNVFNSQNNELNEDASMKSDGSDRTVEMDYTDCSDEENNVQTYKPSDPISVENEGFLRDSLKKDVALLDEEIRKRLLDVPSLFLPENETLYDSFRPGGSIGNIANDSVFSTETLEDFDASDSSNSVNSPRANKHHCFDCRKNFSSYKTYRAHRRRLHPLTCDRCNEKFLDLILYQSHMQSHIQSGQAKRYDCPVCGKYIKDASSRAKHLRLHTGEKPYACEICGKRFTQTGHLASHMRLHSGEKPFDCRLCGKFFSEKSSVKRHLRKIHFNQYNKKCNECGLLCVTREDYKEHMLTHTKNVYSCEICQKDFPDSKRLKLHNFNSHDKLNLDARTYACKDCDRYFFSTKGLKNHVKRFHTNEIPFYNCAMCSRTFLTTLTLESHMASHMKKDLVCLACNKIFRTNGSLSLHKKRHIISFIQKSEKAALDVDIENDLQTKEKPDHVENQATKNENQNEMNVRSEPSDDVSDDDDNERNIKTNTDHVNSKAATKSKEIERLIEDYVLTIKDTSVYTNYCIYRPECILDNTLLEKYLIDVENKTEIDEKKPDPKLIFGNRTNPRSLNVYKCNSCGLFLTTKKHLMRHVIALHKQKSVKCHLCSSKFSTNILLRAHIKRMHETASAGKLACKYCNKELKDERNLREHLKIHTGNLPYACKVCPRTFRTHSKLIFHMEAHNKVQRQCPKCNTKFVHERSYRQHVQAQCLGRRKRAKIGIHKRQVENYFMNYNCTICGRQYRYQESLYLHIKTDHDGIDVDMKDDGIDINIKDNGIDVDIKDGEENNFDIDQHIIDDAIKDVENGMVEDEVSNTSHNSVIDNTEKLELEANIGEVIQADIPKA